MTKVQVLFDATASRYARNARYYYGYVSETDLGDRCRMTFLIGNMRSFCSWLMMFGKAVEIESPNELKETMDELLEELITHHSTSEVLK
jgi:predicted DNA-binding transcriptional regulator YafY